MNTLIYENDSLQHYGVIGMKWGVRRYQNKDGSLTPAGKKKISMKYRKLMDKANNEMERDEKKRHLDAWNRAVSEMRNGGKDKLDKALKNKYLEYYDDIDLDKYDEAIRSKTRDIQDAIYNSMNVSLYDTNKHYKEAIKLVEKYKMEEWDLIASMYRNDERIARENMDKYMRGDYDRRDYLGDYLPPEAEKDRLRDFMDKYTHGYMDE